MFQLFDQISSGKFRVFLLLCRGRASKYSEWHSRASLFPGLCHKIASCASYISIFCIIKIDGGPDYVCSVLSPLLWRAAASSAPLRYRPFAQKHGVQNMILSFWVSVSKLPTQPQMSLSFSVFKIRARSFLVCSIISSLYMCKQDRDFDILTSCSKEAKLRNMLSEIAAQVEHRGALSLFQNIDSNTTCLDLFLFTAWGWTTPRF